MLTGFPRAAHIIGAGERAALEALPFIRQVVEGACAVSVGSLADLTAGQRTEREGGESCLNVCQGH